MRPGRPDRPVSTGGNPERSEGAAVESGTEQPFSSTTWEYRKVKISRAASPQSAGASKTLRFRFLPRRDRAKPLTISVQYRGGPECWYLVKARGGSANFHGATGIHDIMEEINGNLR